MTLARWKWAVGFGLAALLSLPALGADAERRMAMPGTLNYVEGQASMGEQQLNSKSVGSAELQNGQILSTGNGKAEILLTPGVYLRVGNNSSVKMISNSLTNIQVALNQGEAMLEVDQLYKENNVQIAQSNANTRIEKTGLYGFDAADNQVRVFDGKAVVSANDHNITVKGGHELGLNGEGKLKAHGFDKKEIVQSDDLYRWSSLRSEYLSEANVDTARLYYANGAWGPGWWGPGWYWDPFFGGFTFLPGDGFFYSPFGWGFYSPIVAYRVPIVVGHGVHHFNGSRPVAIGRGFHKHAVTSVHTGRMSGFHSAPVGHMGGGGFHSGAMNHH
jgi:hypothetical protein